MSHPTEDQIATLSAALETFSRRYKLKDTGAEKPMAELDTQTLFYLKKFPASGPSDVARYLGVALTTVSSATDRLAKRELIERHRSKDDRRAVALSLSAAGQHYVEAQERAYSDMFRMMLGRLTLAERDSFIGMMTKIAYSED